MNLNIVDVIIILIIGLGALVGFKEGAIKRTTSIVGFAFQDFYVLTQVNIPDGVTSIGYHAFYNCKNLAQVNIPDSVTNI